MATAKTVAEVVLGEAAAGDFQDMLAVASVIHNRAQKLGVSMDDVVSVKSQFNAYGKALPSGALSNLGLAQKALDYVASFGPVHNATFFATPSKTSNLPSGLQQEARTEYAVVSPMATSRATRNQKNRMRVGLLVSCQSSGLRSMTFGLFTDCIGQGPHVLPPVPIGDRLFR